MTWQDILAEIREGKDSIPAAKSGIPLVAVNAPFYELMQLMEALTTGYNALFLRAEEDQRRIENVRKLARAHFQAGKKAAQSGWVSVSDRLPDKSGYYMTYSDVMGVYPYPFSAKNGKFNSLDCDNGEHALPVDYWHPAPLPPVVANEEG